MVIDDGVSERSRRLLNPFINLETGEYYGSRSKGYLLQTDNQDLNLEEIIRQVRGVIYTGPFLEETEDQKTARIALEKFIDPETIARALIINYGRKVENEPKLEYGGFSVTYNPKVISKECLKEATDIYQCLAKLQSKYKNNMRKLYESTGYGQIKIGHSKIDNIISDSVRRFKEVYKDLLFGTTREELLKLEIEDEIKGRDVDTTLEIPIKLLERFEIISTLLEYTFNVSEENEFSNIKKLESDPINIDRPPSFKYKLFNRFTLARHIAWILNEYAQIKIETTGLDKLIEEIESRSGELTIGFNERFEPNTINEIKNFSIYNDGTINGRKSEFCDVIASYKHSSDKQIHQLAFNLKDLNGKNKTIGIAIMVDSIGRSIKIKNSEDIGLDNCIILDGFTAVDWFSDLKIENGDDIYERVADTIVDYSSKRKRKLFVNCSHVDSNKLNEVQQSNNNLIRLLAKREGYTYNLGTLRGEFDKLEIGNKIFTHYMKKEPGEQPGDNIQYLHVWKEYKETVLDLIELSKEFKNLTEEPIALSNDEFTLINLSRYRIFNQLRVEGLYEQVINRNNNRKDIIENEGVKMPLPRAWNECSGLVKGFEVKKGLRKAKNIRKSFSIKKLLSVVLPVITSGIIISSDMIKEEVEGEIISKEEVEQIDASYIIYKHNSRFDRTAREIGKSKKRGYREGGFGDSSIPKEGIMDYKHMIPSEEYILEHPEIEIKGAIPLIGKPKLILNGLEFELNDERDLKNIINKIVTLRHERDLRSGRNLQLMRLDLKKHWGRLIN